MKITANYGPRRDGKYLPVTMPDDTQYEVAEDGTFTVPDGNTEHIDFLIATGNFSAQGADDKDPSAGKDQESSVKAMDKVSLLEYGQSIGIDLNQNAPLHILRSQITKALAKAG